MLNSSKKWIRFVLPLLLATSAAMLTGCGGGGSGAAGTTAASGVPAATPVVTASSISLSANPTTVKSDNSNTTTITIAALNAGNAAMPGVTVNLSTNTGVLGAATVVTGATGMSTVTFSTGASNINRTATITATSGTVSAQIPVQVVGSTVVVATTGSTLPDSGSSPVTLTVTTKDASGAVVPGAAVTLSATGAGKVSLTPASGVTNASGQLAVTVAGVTAGAVTVSATALGATATTAFTVSPTAATFAIDQLTLNANPPMTPPFTSVGMKFTDTLNIRVNAPAATNVTFATTMGIWNGVAGQTLLTVPVVAGKASANLTTTQAGIANLVAYDPLNATTSTSSLSVAMTSAIAASITVQATPTTVAKNVAGTTTGTSTLIATVKDNLGNPVGGAPVQFTIVNPTGGGETVSPVVVFTASTPTAGLGLGQANATFTSGSLSSSASGIYIKAQVVGSPAVTTATPPTAPVSPSGSDAAIIIGGTAGSIAFGQATTVSVGGGGTTYILPMSVLVTDSGGNPAPAGTVVTLSAWPSAWSTGSACAIDADTYTAPVAPATIGVGTGTFLNVDTNENLILDPTEDKVRTFEASHTPQSVSTGTPGLLTPPNSAAGSVPSSVTTDASGVASFNLTYPKSSAIWIKTRIRATTLVLGTATVSQTAFRLPALVSDVTPTCYLPNSSFVF